MKVKKQKREDSKGHTGVRSSIVMKSLPHSCGSRVVLYGGEKAEGPQDSDPTVKNTDFGEVEANKLPSKLLRKETRYLAEMQINPLPTI